MYKVERDTISIHAPARGATGSRHSHNAGAGNFNPRSREGSDEKRIDLYHILNISIHAPARGATGNVNKYIPFYWEFQSTLPRGERLLTVSKMLLTSHFNPRSREGSDPYDRILDFCTYISIHAPARGATQPKEKASSGAINFNPRSREGSD